MPDPLPPAQHGARAPRSRTPAPGASASAAASVARRHAALAAAAVALTGVLVWQIVTARGGTPDPTDIPHLGHGAVVADSAILVFREGLECILVLAAITAGLNDAHRIHRRPIAAGAASGRPHRSRRGSSSSRRSAPSARRASTSRPRPDCSRSSSCSSS